MNVNAEIPALRQPKIIYTEKPKVLSSENNNVILTLKDKRTLVVSSDAYHGIVRRRYLFNCVFCEVDMDIDGLSKEAHKGSQKHMRVILEYPHIKEYGEHLIRRLNKENYYCTHCNVPVLYPFLSRHFTTEVHVNELRKAFTRASTYKPFD